MKKTLGPCVVLLAIACGGTDASSFPTPEAKTEAPPAPEPNGLGDTTPTSQQACATGLVESAIAPVHLVISQDISGSMCQLPSEPVSLVGASCARPGTKWELTQTALNTFFTSAASANTFVSVIPWSGLSCGTFETPLNATEVALPDAAGKLRTALKTVAPSSATPTSSAIDGAVAYAKRLQASLTDGGKVVIALATDGEPTACGDYIGALASAGAARSSGFGPYIIGVGSEIPKLDALAAAAGTNSSKAFLVQGSNMASELNATLTTIKENAIRCEVKIPKAPDGQTADYAKLNVVTGDGMNEKTVPYSQDCSNADGWRYTPNASAPVNVELCSTRCDSIKKGAKASIKMVLGCATQMTK
jgi:hypothetical protein